MGTKLILEELPPGLRKSADLDTFLRMGFSATLYKIQMIKLVIFRGVLAPYPGDTTTGWACKYRYDAYPIPG